MPEWGPGLTEADMNASLLAKYISQDPSARAGASESGMFADVFGAKAQFVSSSIMSVDTLLANFPAGAAYRGKYARVNDYGGYVDRVLRCDYDSGGMYFWGPSGNTEYGRTVALTGNMTLFPLKSPTSLILTGTIGLGITREITLSTDNGRPGEIKEIAATGITSLLGGLQIAGTGILSAVGLVLGGYRKFVLDYAGGSLSWVRLV